MCAIDCHWLNNQSIVKIYYFENEKRAKSHTKKVETFDWT